MKEVATICYGSQNYRLDSPESDYDYKVIMTPEFEDFYTYHKVDKNDLPEGYDPEHYNVMSILTFDKNIRNGNINAIELLFSQHSEVKDPYFDFYLNKARKAYREGYIFPVWNKFIVTVEGMIKNSLERYGVNRKSASRALYFISLCSFVAEHDFAMDNTTWGRYEVFSSARELRFNEERELPTKEAILATFEDTKRFAEHCRNYHLLMHSESELNLIAAWDDDLAICMKNTVKGYLKKEL